MAYSRTKYDSCNNINECNMSQNPFNHHVNITRFESPSYNNNKCASNNNTNISITNTDIKKKINIESELRGLNYTLGKCNNNEPTLCNVGLKSQNTSSFCNTLTEIPALCERSIVNYGQNANFICNK